MIFSKLKSTDDLTLPWLLVLKVTNLTSFSFQSGRERKKSLNQNSVLRCDDLMWKSLRSELNCSGSVVHLRELSVLSSYLPSFPTPRPPSSIPHPRWALISQFGLIFPGEGQSDGDMLGTRLNLNISVTKIREASFSFKTQFVFFCIAIGFSIKCEWYCLFQ